MENSRRRERQVFLREQGGGADVISSTQKEPPKKSEGVRGMERGSTESREWCGGGGGDGGVDDLGLDLPPIALLKKISPAENGWPAAGRRPRALVPHDGASIELVSCRVRLGSC